ncbi:MAG TPA: methionyl-tRNA formyltransferase [Acidobacteriota bacterium]|nr:methionyl-tRNA formyltransferase [Acidobacteriota bacterium]
MADKLKVVFFGSPELAIPAMREIAADPRLVLLGAVTQPDRPAGRGRKPKPPPIKQEALAAGVDVLQPESISATHVKWALKEFKADYFVVVAYGRILPAHVLEIPRLGCMNLHFSLLPRLRGAAPVNWALVRGETVTGVTTMLMDEGLDTGPVLLQQEIKIEPDETAGFLARRLAEAGAALLTHSLIEYAEGRIDPRQQDHSLATKAPMLKKKHGLVDWNKDAVKIYNRWRGLDPWPGIHSSFRGETIKLIEVACAMGKSLDKEPGTLMREENRLFAACGGGSALEIRSIQMPGRRPVVAIDFANGYRLSEGELLGNAGA